ncbi:hypothetical protein CXB51_032302 [Gossypium anomalum]|uniref:Uncharacterized protein n=1 Tax=Gossypium anomalum TaxID=47600 RepID=A0A8J5Y5M2_9ROSI|nr:hypothetical protein CXB51_032302 [Gossypium anomalum]
MKAGIAKLKENFHLPIFNWILPEKRNDEKTRGKSSTSGSAIKGFPRAVGAGSESYTIAADAFRRPISGAGVEVSPSILVDDDDISGGIRLADARDIGFVDVVWIGYFLYRFLVDALGYWLVHGILRCWDCFRDFHVRSFYFLSRHGPPSFASKGYSCMEGFVKRKGGWGKESGCLKRMEQHWSCCEGATRREKEFSSHPICTAGNNLLPMLYPKRYIDGQKHNQNLQRICAVQVN